MCKCMICVDNSLSLGFMLQKASSSTRWISESMGIEVSKFAQIASDRAQLKNLGLPSSVRTRDIFN